jgi:hypothetical protein
VSLLASWGFPGFLWLAWAAGASKPSFPTRKGPPSTVFIARKLALTTSGLGTLSGAFRPTGLPTRKFPRGVLASANAPESRKKTYSLNPKSLRMRPRVASKPKDLSTNHCECIRDPQANPKPRIQNLQKESANTTEVGI